MLYKVKHQYHLHAINGVEIEHDVVRIRWSTDSEIFSRNNFVTLNAVGGRNKAYRILKGASFEKINKDEALVSYSKFKYLDNNEDYELSIRKSNLWERNVLFYFDHPDPRKRHELVRDFVVTFAGFIVSIFEILRFFGIYF